MAVDDQEVEAWYLEGWCFFLMAEKSKETGESVEGLGWQELAQDSRDCLDACQTVSQFSLREILREFDNDPFSAAARKSRAP